MSAVTAIARPTAPKPIQPPPVSGHGRGCGGEADRPGVVSGQREEQSHQRKTDPRERRLEALRAGEHEAGTLHAAESAENLTPARARTGQVYPASWELFVESK